MAWLTWAAASGAALAFVLLFGSNVPYWDEWELVPAATGHQPITLDFLWSLHNEHRIPLGRLLYIALFRATQDFRAGMVFDVLVLSAAAALLIETARRVRGRGCWVDGVFALLLLNPGHAQNLLWSFQIPVVLIPVLLALALSAAVFVRSGRSGRPVVSVAVPLLLTPLCGAQGVVLSSVAGAWLFWVSLRNKLWRLPAALGALCWALVGLYLYHYHPNSGHPAPAAPGLALRSIGEVLSVAFGAGGAWYWWWTAPFVLGVAGFTFLALLVLWRRSPADREAVEALLAMAVATGGLAAVVGWGRSGFGAGAGFAGRYAALSAPLVCWACLSWCRLPWRRLALAVQAACWIGAVLLYPENLAAGREEGETRRAGLQALVHDLRRSTALEKVAARHRDTVYPDPGLLSERLEMLRQGRLGPFSRADQVAALRRRFAFVTAPLIEVRDGLVPAQVDRVYGRMAIVVHADGELAFDVRPGQREVSGYFGVAPAYRQTGEPAYDGTGFTAAFRSDAGDRIELFSRVLDPLRTTADRGFVPFRVPIPRSGGTLLLSTRSGAPGANSFGDWGCWAAIELR